LKRESVIQIPTSCFSLRYTFESANPLTFFGSYDPADNSVSYPVGRSIIKVRSTGSSKKGKLLIMEGPPSARREAISRFRLDDDMEEIYGKIATDGFMRGAVSRYAGMRLTLNDPWEAVLCFIISQFNNVKRIRRITMSIVNRFGAYITDSEGRAVARGFPDSATMAEASAKEFRECGAGFRAKYIKEAAEYCTNNLDIYKLSRLDYPELREELMGIKGVGEKVADCIALMGYGKLEAFPIDVWVKRTMERIYFKGRSMRTSELRSFAEDKFGPYAGCAQQYIFWHGRNSA
jgi:N-glycosylase/DNA lyase